MSSAQSVDSGNVSSSSLQNSFADNADISSQNDKQGSNISNLNPIRSTRKDSQTSKSIKKAKKRKISPIQKRIRTSKPPPVLPLSEELKRKNRQHHHHDMQHPFPKRLKASHPTVTVAREFRSQVEEGDDDDDGDDDGDDDEEVQNPSSGYCHRHHRHHHPSPQQQHTHQSRRHQSSSQQQLDHRHLSKEQQGPSPAQYLHDERIQQPCTPSCYHKPLHSIQEDRRHSCNDRSRCSCRYSGSSYSRVDPIQVGSCEQNHDCNQNLTRRVQTLEYSPSSSFFHLPPQQQQLHHHFYHYPFPSTSPVGLPTCPTMMMISPHLISNNPLTQSTSSQSNLNSSYSNIYSQKENAPVNSNKVESPNHRGHSHSSSANAQPSSEFVCNHPNHSNHPYHQPQSRGNHCDAETAENSTTSFAMNLDAINANHLGASMIDHERFSFPIPTECSQQSTCESGSMHTAMGQFTIFEPPPAKQTARRSKRMRGAPQDSHRCSLFESQMDVENVDARDSTYETHSSFSPLSKTTPTLAHSFSGCTPDSNSGAPIFPSGCKTTTTTTSPIINQLSNQQDIVEHHTELDPTNASGIIDVVTLITANLWAHPIAICGLTASLLLWLML